MELDENLTPQQAFELMREYGYNTLEARIKGRGRIIFTLDADVPSRHG
jgi:hypothetical protein